ncbi:tRNA threonylcarbamoyladenosine biosynthesis protein TsaB [Alteromonadaceae bacterium Bs31]|nr:tRNA threonylcarbamoyladenosine biosynthesis protein TsaB [Alteromonadaceae bacterium Bs31]
MTKSSPFNILAVDASTEVCSLALSVNGNTSSRSCDTPKSHSKVLLPLIEELLSEASLGLKGLDAIAVSVGPGSFTGIRIGLGVVQGLSYGADLPIIGLSTLELMALQCAKSLDLETKPGYPPQGSCEKTSVIIPALDARMGEVYWQAYTREEGAIVVSCLEPKVCSPSAFLEDIEDNFRGATIMACGHGWALPELNDYSVEARYPELKPHASDALILAEQKLLQNGKEHFPIGSIEPLYLRNEVSWHKRKRIRQRH